MNEYLILYSNCVLVKGYTHAAIYDLHRNSLYKFGNSFYEIMAESRKYTIDIMAKRLSKIERQDFDIFINYLLENELAFFTNNVKLFPKLSSQWDEPFIFTNSIIDIKEDINLSKKFIKELIEIGCHTLQIRFFKFYSIELISELLELLEKSNISCIEILLPYHIEYSIKYLKPFCQKYKRVSIIIIYACRFQKNSRTRPNEFGRIFFIRDKVLNEKSCGIISPSFFTINIKTYTESLKYNSCLNRKISIDTAGNIKNCPSLHETYGNIKDTTLEEAIKKPGFKKYWNINKDKIHVCKDCEFRYICTDCRAYVEDPGDILSKPLKCGYNPYTGEWSEWSTNPLKQKAIAYYAMEDLVKERQSRLAEKESK
ncbi:MAG: grasp-with-spasm system SPASM domain peptide maturase [Saprospiraceae bacterium]